MNWCGWLLSVSGVVMVPLKHIEIWLHGHSKTVVQFYCSRRFTLHCFASCTQAQWVNTILGLSWVSQQWSVRCTKTLVLSIPVTMATDCSVHCHLGRGWVNWKCNGELSTPVILIAWMVIIHSCRSHGSGALVEIIIKWDPLLRFRSHGSSFVVSVC